MKSDANDDDDSTECDNISRYNVTQCVIKRLSKHLKKRAKIAPKF